MSERGKPSSPAALLERLRALPFDVRKEVLGGLPVGGAVVLVLPEDEQVVYGISREAETVFEVTPMTRDECVNGLVEAYRQAALVSLPMKGKPS